MMGGLWRKESECVNRGIVESFAKVCMGLLLSHRIIPYNPPSTIENIELEPEIDSFCFFCAAMWKFRAYSDSRSDLVRM